MSNKNPQAEYDALMKQLYREYGEEKITQFCEYVRLTSTKEAEGIRVFTSNRTTNGN